MPISLIQLQAELTWFRIQIFWIAPNRKHMKLYD